MALLWGCAESVQRPRFGAGNFKRLSWPFCGNVGREHGLYFRWRTATVPFTLGTLSAKICSVKLRATLLLSSFLVVPVVATCATVLPDACGNEKVSFEIQLQKNPPGPAAPEAGKLLKPSQSPVFPLYW
jgi:hypothetical protein